MVAGDPVDRGKVDLTDAGMGLPANMAFVYSVIPFSFSIAVFVTSVGPRVEVGDVVVGTKVVE